MAAPDLYDLLVKQGIMTPAEATAARAAAAANAAGGGSTNTKPVAPTTTVYPTISSSTDATALINKVFQNALKRDASAAEMKYWKPLLAAAQKANGAQQSYTIKGKTGTQTTITGLNDEVWLEGQLTRNTDYKKELPKIDYAAELNAVKLTDPTLFNRMQDKKIYVDAIKAAAGDQAKIDAANNITTYGRGLSELLANIQTVAESNGAINTPEELASLATTLYDKGIAANSGKASVAINNVLKNANGLIKNQPTDFAQRTADKKIYDQLIAEAGNDPAKIQNANETTAYGRGLAEMLSNIQDKADANGAINTDEELTSLAKKLYDKGILFNSSQGTKELDSVLKTDAGLVKDQSPELLQIAADKKVYNKLIAAAENDPAAIKNVNEVTAYGRGLKSLLANIQAKAEASGATNTPEELSSLAQKLYDKGLSVTSPEGVSEIGAVLTTGGNLVKTQAADLVQRLADKKIYDNLITAAAGDPAKIKAAQETTDYGRGLKEITAAIQAKAESSNATNTPEELAALAQSMYDKGILPTSAQGVAQLNSTFRTDTGLVKGQEADLLQIATDKKAYQTKLAAAGSDPAKIQNVMDTTAYGRGLKEILANLQAKASSSGAINTPEELKTLAESLYDKGIALNSFEGLTLVENVLKNTQGLIKNQPPDLTKLAADKAVYDNLIAAANGNPTAIAQANDTTAYGRGLKEMLATIQAKATDSGATNTPEELSSLAQSLYSKGIFLTSSQGLAAVDAFLKNDAGLIKGQQTDLAQIAKDKKEYQTKIAAAGSDPAKIQNVMDTTTYGRGLKEILATLQAKATSSGAINTTKELTTLAENLYDKGVGLNSAEGTAAINAVLRNAQGLIEGQPADLVKIAADKKIYEKAISAAGDDPAAIQKAMSSTNYGRGLKSVLAAIQAKATDVGATNTTEELTKLAQSLYDQGLSLNTYEGLAAVDDVLKNATGLIKDLPADLTKIAVDKGIYDKLIAKAGTDPVAIQKVKDTTAYGRGIKDLLLSIQTKATDSGATNTPEELTALAQKLYDGGITLNSPQGLDAVNSTLRNENGLIKDLPADLTRLASDKAVYDKLITAAAGDATAIAKANNTTAYGRGLKEVLAAIQSKATDLGATNSPDELTALAKKLYDNGTSLNSYEGLAAVDSVLKTNAGLIKDQPADLVKIAADKKIYDNLIATANGDPAAIAKAKQTTTYGRGLASLEATISKLASDQGASNDPTEIAALAQDLYNKGVSPAGDIGKAQINSVLKYGADATTGKYKGTAGTTIADLQATAEANGLDLQKNFGNKVAGWITAINSGEQVDNIKQQIRDVAKLGQPESVKKLIDNGNDLATIYTPYKNTMASTLEIQDPNSISLNDPTLRMAITPTGEMNLYDYQKVLRKDNRWQYTQGANQEVASTTQKVLKDFGFQG